MSLIAAIQSQGLTGTPAEVVSAFGDLIDLPHNHDLWSYNGVATTFGDAAAEALAQAMTTAGLATAAMVYASKGFDLSLQQTQDKLDAIAVGVPPLAQVCIALKAIGRPTTTRWEFCGLSALPTESEVAAALTTITNQQQIAALANEVINPALSNPATTLASLKAAVAAWGV